MLPSMSRRCLPRERETCGCNGVTRPCWRVTSSTFPPAVTAASMPTARFGSPWTPAAEAADTGAGHAEKVVTVCGSVCSSPKSSGSAAACVLVASERGG